MKAREPEPVSAAVASRPVVNPRLNDLFAAHYRRVLRAAYRITGNMADAEDVAQNLFLRLGQNALPEATNPGSYLYRAAVNGALDLLRRRKDAEPLEAAEAVPSTSFGSSPEIALENKELGRLLRQAIGELSQRSAEIFVLRYVEEMENREIAALLQTSPTVIAVTLYQARLKLRKRLAQLQRGMQ